MPEVQAIPLISNVLGLNRDVAKHRLSEQESPSSIDTDYAGDIQGLLGPRGGRSRAIRGGGTLRGVMPFFFPWNPYRVIAYDDTYSADPVTWPTPTLASIPALPSLEGFLSTAAGSGKIGMFSGSGLELVTPWGTCNTGNRSVVDPFGGLITFTDQAPDPEEIELLAVAAGRFTMNYSGVLNTTTIGLLKTCLVNGAQQAAGVYSDWQTLCPVTGTVFTINPLV